jgi:hypothetical protein
LWVILVSFATITLCVASQRVFIVVYLVIDSVRKPVASLTAPIFRANRHHRWNLGARKRPTLAVAKKFKSQPSAGKIMLTFFGGYEKCDFGSFHSTGWNR